VVALSEFALAALCGLALNVAADSEVQLSVVQGPWNVALYEVVVLRHIIAQRLISAEIVALRAYCLLVVAMFLLMSLWGAVLQKKSRSPKLRQQHLPPALGAGPMKLRNQTFRNGLRCEALKLRLLTMCHIPVAYCFLQNLSSCVQLPSNASKESSFFFRSGLSHSQK
jgi:hypothetical protein